jgi:hypothetical protein
VSSRRRKRHPRRSPRGQTAKEKNARIIRFYPRKRETTSLA